MFLEKILAQQYAEVERRKTIHPLAVIYQELEQELIESRAFRLRLTAERIQLIAEIKKASPSKGLLCPDFNPQALALAYEQAGAAAISVLTEEKFFQGSLRYLNVAKKMTRITPILRKDFIVDPYQLAEAKLFGADAVLLIVAALEDKQLILLHQKTLDLGMTPLVEVHNHEELQRALGAGAEVIGINNRNLHTFEVDLATTFELITEIPDELLVISESGITNPEDIRLLERAGVNGVLVGESLVTADDPGLKINQLLGVG